MRRDSEMKQRGCPAIYCGVARSGLLLTEGYAMEQRKKYPIDYLRVMIFIALFLSISCGTLQCQASENEKFSALVIDNSSVKTHVYDLYLRSHSGGHWYTGYAGIKYWSSGGEIIKKDIIIGNVLT